MGNSKKYIVKIVDEDKFLCTSKEINEGDKVLVEYTDGYKTTGEFTIGILTRKWVDGPYCAVDGKEIDLAGEAHSSNVYKIVCDINERWVKDGMEFNEKEVEFEKYDDRKRGKYLEKGDKIEFQEGKFGHTIGEIKEIKLKDEGAWDWEDKCTIINVKEQISIKEDGEPIFENKPDIIRTRGKIRGKTKHIIECRIKCICCGK